MGNARFPDLATVLLVGGAARAPVVAPVPRQRQREGGPSWTRSALQRTTAWAALRAARDTSTPATREAALAAMCAASSAYLHPLADGHQVRHILGAGAHAARAAELTAGDDRDVGWAHLHAIAERAPSGVRDVLGRYPSPPSGGARVGELMRALDTALRR